MNDKTDDPVARIMAHVSAGPDRVHERSEVQYWNSLSPASQGIWHCRASAARIAVIKEMIGEEPSEEVLDAGRWASGGMTLNLEVFRVEYKAMLTAKLKDLEG